MAFLAAAGEAGGAAGARAAASAGSRGAAAKGARRGAAGKRAAGGASSSAGRKITPDLSPDEVTEELQRRRRLAATPAAPADNDAGDQDDAGDPDQDQEGPGERSGGQRLRLQPMKPTTSGAGFVLGVGVWLLVSNLIDGGPKQVRAFLAAKFLNKTGA